MKKILALIVFHLAVIAAFSQHQLKIKITQEGGEPLSGANIKIASISKLSSADSSGIILFKNLPPGKFKLDITYAGFEEKLVTVTIPYNGDILEIELEASEEEEEVIVQSTRTSRTIPNVPTRIETIGMEEIDEKSNMRPSNISMLLHESTGIQVQQTSATSANASIRIQGLDGRYTQLLKDGFAAFGNFASGLSVLEIPPLDLKQVEIIKGPVSPLFGGGAIAGVVNFISRTPGEKAENQITLNQSHLGQTNVGYFSSGRNKKLGYTFFGLLNKQRAFDVDKDDFTELPKATEFTIHPKLFIYPNANTSLVIGNSLTKGIRTGGDMQVIKGKADSLHRYFEENNTIRNISTLEFRKKMAANNEFTFKQSFSIFDRHIEIPGYHFDGVSYNSFTDVDYLVIKEKHAIVAGINLVYDYFNENNNSVEDRDNKQSTAGFYIQDTWDISTKVVLETGLRTEHAHFSNPGFSRSEFFVLPRISMLIRLDSKWSSRIGGGMGYKLPSLFTERTETMQYQGIGQLNNVVSERSYGGTADINFKNRIAPQTELSFNHMFFYTWIDNPLVLEGNSTGGLSFVNAAKPVQTKGFETNAKFIYKHYYKLFLGYTFTDAKATYLTGNQFLPLVPKHKFNSALIYEKHGSLKLGLEAYYTGPQFLFNGAKTPGYWEFGFMAEKFWKKFSVYVNFENFTDMRQSNFKTVSNGPHHSPTFDDLWTHTEGIIVSGGVKLKF